MPPSAEQEAMEKSFPSIPPISSVQSISDTPKNVRPANPPRPKRNGGDSVVPIDEEKKIAEAEKKQEEKEDQWKSARDNQENDDIAKAA